MSGPTPRRLLHFVTRRLRLKKYLRDPGDGRRQPQIPAQLLLWALLVGQILRQHSFHALEALVRSAARRNLSRSAAFSDDALGYFTERLDPGPTRQALLSVVRRAKRNKAFENCYRIGLAIDGTGAGWRTHASCALCRPQRNAKKQKLGYQHSFVLISVVGTGLSLPLDVEPYGPGDSEYAAGQRLLQRVIGGLGKRFAQYVVVDGEFATAPFLHTAGDLGFGVVARLKDNLPELFTAAQKRFPSGPPTAVFRHEQDRVEIWEALPDCRLVHKTSTQPLHFFARGLRTSEIADTEYTESEATVLVNAVPGNLAICLDCPRASVARAKFTGYDCAAVNAG